MTNELCPFCNTKNLTLREDEQEIPYFGKVYVFSMTCTHCKYHKADIEVEENQNPSKWEFEITSEADMSVRVIKSSTATIKIPRIMNIEPGTASNGYVSNIEGILVRVKTRLEKSRDSEEDATKKKKLKNMIKKIQKVMFGSETLKISIEDPAGNSAIISEKAKKTGMKKGK